MQLLEQGDRLADHQPVLDSDGIPGVDVGALPQDDGRPSRISFSISSSPASASAARATSSASHWPGLAADRDRRDAVCQRIERDERAEEATALAVDAVESVDRRHSGLLDPRPPGEGP